MGADFQGSGCGFAMASLSDSFARMFSPGGFVPRRVCGTWPDWLVREHVIGNGLVWLAYVAMPVLLWRLARRRSEFPQITRLMRAFAGFVILCGLGHFLDMLAFFRPMYRLSGHVLIVTGLASWWTALALHRAWPVLIAMRSPDQLRHEVAQRTAELARVNRGLGESEAQFHQLAESIPQLAWMARPDGHITWYNRRWYDYTGTTPEQMEGWGWQSVHDPAGLPGVLARWQDCIASGEPFEMVFPLLGGDGHFRQFLTRVEAFRGADGRILNWFGTNTDIHDQKRAEDGLKLAREELEGRVEERTRELASANEGLRREVKERRRAEGELRRGEEQFRTLADSIPQLAWMARPDGYIFWYNRRWYDYTGTTLEQMEGWGWQSVHDPAELPRVVETIKASFASGEPWECTFPLRRHDGVFRWHLSRMLPVKDEAGRVTLWFGSNTDITEHKQLESTLREAKEAAEAATRSKSEFLANMSHEIRTPMNGILGMTGLALETDLTAEQREYLGMVESSAESLLIILNDILDFSKIEAGKLDLDPVPFSLRDCLDGTLKEQALRAHAKGLELACRIAPDTPDALMGDAGRLRQVAANLISNAIKFTERGEVIVSADVARGGDGGLTLHIAVADTGVGIPADKLAVIFDPFEQADGSTTRRYGGTGLGLTISAKLVALMGGRIWVESEPGRGSTFHFTVAIREADAPAPVRAASPGPDPLRGLPVLVADDNATNRRILEGVLAGCGMRPTAVDGGRAALAELSRAVDSGDPFPVVLLDARMPDIDGFAVAEAIGRDPGLAGSAILMLSSGDRTGEAARCRELGVRQHLTKPVHNAELIAALRDALGAARPGPAGPPAASAEPGPATRRLRILLAEDNVVNQRVAVRLLERRGHSVVVAADGREALAALEAHEFDLVLMDVHMPHVGGFEATARVRRREARSGRHVPIVAMTARAMKGDRERCLEAGMDGYVAKPVREAELWGAIEAALAPDRGGPPPAGPTDCPGVRHLPDEDELLAHAGGDAALLAELAGLFLAEGPRLVEEVGAALRDSDAQGLQLAAHALKGTLAHFCAPAAIDAARTLEAMGEGGDLDGSARAFASLVREVDRIGPTVRRLAAEQIPS